MKKLIGLALTTVMVAAFTTGCTQGPTEPAAAGSVTLKDGIYSAVGEADKSGWKPEISITISSGKVTAVKYDEAAALRKSESIEYQKSFKAQTKIDLPNVYATLQNSLIKGQDVSKLDTVAGATKAADNFKALAAEALKSAVVEGKFKDGEYSATGTKDEKNWTPFITITVKSGKIEAVKYDEVSSNIFKNKSKDQVYTAKYKEKSKLDLTAVYDKLQKALIEKQDPAKLDAIAGATQTRDNFIKLAADAINKAK